MSREQKQESVIERVKIEIEKMIPVVKERFGIDLVLSSKDIQTQTRTDSFEVWLDSEQINTFENRIIIPMQYFDDGVLVVDVETRVRVWLHPENKYYKIPTLVSF